MNLSKKAKEKLESTYLNLRVGEVLMELE